MKKKALFSLSLSSLILLSPLPFVVSCSKSNISYPNSTKVKNELEQGNIKIILKTDSKDLKITDFDNLKIDFEVDESLKSTDEGKQHYDEIVSNLNKSKVVFHDYYIPRLNEDSESFILFSIDDENEIAEVKLSKIIDSNSKTLINLSETEIQETIKKKMNNERDFIINLKDRTQNLFSQVYSSYKVTMEKENDQNEIKSFLSFLNEDFEKFMSMSWRSYFKNALLWYIDESFDCFNNVYYKNIEISSNNSDMKCELGEKMGSYKITFKISTMPIDTYPNCSYEVTTTIWID